MTKQNCLTAFSPPSCACINQPNNHSYTTNTNMTPTQIKAEGVKFSMLIIVVYVHIQSDLDMSYKHSCIGKTFCILCTLVLMMTRLHCCH